ncbi:hypothetical protein ACFLR1_00740 [Bacteroidota bacterium]
MNLQEILAPVEDLLLWTFSILEAGGNGFNYFLMAFFAIGLVYWTFKLIGFQKDEIPNR